MRSPNAFAVRPLVIVCAIALMAIYSSCSSSLAPESQSLQLKFAYKFGTPQYDSLFPVFPNPFSRIAGDTALTIRFTLKDTARDVHVLVQTVIGDEISSFTDSVSGPGTYTGSWNPIASDGTPLRSGLYFVTLRSPNYIDSRLVNIQDNE